MMYVYGRSSAGLGNQLPALFGASSGRHRHPDATEPRISGNVPTVEEIPSVEIEKKNS